IVPPSIVSMRKGSTAASTTDPSSVCYTCHKLLTPLAFQRSAWNDNGDYAPYQPKSGAVPAVFTGKKKGLTPAVVLNSTNGDPVDDTDHGLVHSYPFRGKGMQAFAMAAQRKEAFIRTIIQTHFNFFFGRAMRYDSDERGLYRRLWVETERDHFAIRPLIRAMVTSDTYLNGTPPPRKTSTVVALSRSRVRKNARG
ncbi:MAG: hypothetical protein LC772_12540, partial [Chloroflexi bacterium]|nr:hypothetical protein [Chloroflexota bacterium]